jgi:C4-dicarboxylate transporter DctQ subunit
MKKLLLLIDSLLTGVLITIVITQAFILIISIFRRFILNSPILWVDEVIRYLLVWVSFLGMGFVTKEHKHIEVTAIDSYIPVKIATLLNYFVDIIILFIMVIMIYFGIIVTSGQMNVRGQTIAWLSFGYVYLAIPVGCIVGIAFHMRKWYFNFHPNKETNSD